MQPYIFKEIPFPVSKQPFFKLPFKSCPRGRNHEMKLTLCSQEPHQALEPCFSTGWANFHYFNQPVTFSKILSQFPFLQRRGDFLLTPKHLGIFQFSVLIKLNPLCWTLRGRKFIDKINQQHQNDNLRYKWPQYSILCISICILFKGNSVRSFLLWFCLTMYSLLPYLVCLFSHKY